MDCAQHQCTGHEHPAYACTCPPKDETILGGEWVEVTAAEYSKVSTTTGALRRVVSVRTGKGRDMEMKDTFEVWQPALPDYAVGTLLIGTLKDQPSVRRILEKFPDDGDHRPWTVYGAEGYRKQSDESIRARYDLRVIIETKAVE